VCYVDIGEVAVIEDYDDVGVGSVITYCQC
jgi:hypothetical protein